MIKSKRENEFDPIQNDTLTFDTRSINRSVFNTLNNNNYKYVITKKQTNGGVRKIK